MLTALLSNLCSNDLNEHQTYNRDSGTSKVANYIMGPNVSFAVVLVFNISASL